MDRKGRGAGQGQGGKTDQPHRDVLRGVAEGADGAGQFRHAAVAEGHAVATALAHHKKGQAQQQQEMQSGPEGQGVAGGDRVHEHRLRVHHR